MHLHVQPVRHLVVLQQRECVNQLMACIRNIGKIGGKVEELLVGKQKKEERASRINYVGSLVLIFKRRIYKDICSCNEHARLREIGNYDDNFYKLFEINYTS